MVLVARLNPSTTALIPNVTRLSSAVVIYSEDPGLFQQAVEAYPDR